MRLRGLKPEVSLAQAQNEMTVISERLERQYPETNREVRAFVTPLQNEIVGNVQAMLYLVLGAVGVVLLTACATMATLLLAKATSRRPRSRSEPRSAPAARASSAATRRGRRAGAAGGRGRRRDCGLGHARVGGLRARRRPASRRSLRQHHRASVRAGAERGGQRALWLAAGTAGVAGRTSVSRFGTAACE